MTDIRVEFGRLVEGWQATQRQLASAVLRDDQPAIDQLLAERADWQAVMDRCPKFVGAAK